MIFFSIILPVFNCQEYISRCLVSILKQNYRNFELIIIDDGSTDESGKICDEFAEIDKRIIVKHYPNRGVSVARNSGIDLAKGDYILFVDADDVITERILSDALLAISNFDADIVYGLVKKVKEPMKCFQDSSVPIFKELFESEVTRLFTHMYNLDCADFFVDEAYVSRGPVAKIVKSTLVKKIKFNQDLKIGEDAIWNMSILSDKPKCVMCKNIWYLYFYVSTSASHKYRSDLENEYSLLLKESLKFVDSELLRHCYLNRVWALTRKLIINKFKYNNENIGLFKVVKDTCALMRMYPWNIPLQRKWLVRSSVKDRLKIILLKTGMLVFIVKFFYDTNDVLDL